MPPQEYVKLIKKEIRLRHSGVPTKEISTIYFGGGTPSLLDPPLILSILDELANAGFNFSHLMETTIEINPATMDQNKLEQYLKFGINRFSVGAQSFNDQLLQLCGRRHSAQDTRITLSLLKSEGLNFSFDLLFALPGQSLEQVIADVDEALTFSPPHMSLYCLTVPEGHPMATGRAPDETQLEMFNKIEEKLGAAGLCKYEISNYSLPGLESRHNLAYWQDRDYWGLGLSAHSYFKEPQWGIRFWNPKSFEAYSEQLTLRVNAPFMALPKDHKEFLIEEESLTDFCHMSLRMSEGLSMDAVQKKFSHRAVAELSNRMECIRGKGWVHQYRPTQWKLTSEGENLLNQVLLDLSFSPFR